MLHGRGRLVCLAVANRLCVATLTKVLGFCRFHGTWAVRVSLRSPGGYLASCVRAMPDVVPTPVGIPCPACGGASKIIAHMPKFRDGSEDVISTTYEHQCLTCEHIFQTTDATEGEQ
jgi:hypothetical protein